MDMRVVEVAMGLVLVFALTSLLVTALQEAFSSWSKMRGKVLCDAITSFLGDDDVFAKALLDHPLVVSLAQQRQSERGARRPSYANADLIVAALIGHLCDTHTGGQRPSTPAQLLDALRERQGTRIGATTPSASTVTMADAADVAPNALFLRGLSAVALGAEHDWVAFEKRLCAWFDAVGERSSGWFKRKTQLGVFVLGFGVAAVMNINPIVITSRLWSSDELRVAVADAAERVTAAHNAMYADASRQPAPSQGAAQGAGANTNAVGPVAPDAAAIDASMKRLWSSMQDLQAARPNDHATAEMLDMALRLDDAVKAWRDSGSKTEGENARTLRLHAALATSADAPPIAADALRETAALLDRATQPAPAKTPENPEAPADLRAHASLDLICKSDGNGAGTHSDLDALCAHWKQLDELHKLGLPIGWDKAALPTVFADQGVAAFGNYLLAVVGWAMVGLASTLGAPFWFDALGKLVLLRGAGGRKEPAPAGSAGDAGSRSLLEPATQPPSGGPADAMSDALNDVERALSSAEITRLQQALGLQGAALSGRFDGPTRELIAARQQRTGQVPADGELTEVQIRQLLGTTSGAVPSKANIGSPTAALDDAEDADGCGTPINSPTEDAALPVATGGVEQQ